MRNVFSPSALGLAHEYISTEQNGLHSYGGSQSARIRTRRCAPAVCGVIVGLDVTLHQPPFGRHLPVCGGGRRQSVPLSVYNSFLRVAVRRGFLPLIPGGGINGLMLTGGLELFFLRWRMPYSIYWGASGSLFENIELMLMRDIPVILAVSRISRCSGRRTTCRSTAVSWTERSSKLHRPRTLRGRHGDGRGVAAHIVMGAGYYINREEYMAYGRKHSLPILNSIAVIRPKVRADTAIKITAENFAVIFCFQT